MNKKRSLSKGKKEASGTVYEEAFRLFTQGCSNQQIERGCRLGQLGLTEVLEPSIELVLDQIEKMVTKNVKFHRSTSYFIRRKQFVSDMILRRTAILHSRTFQPSEKDLVSEFLSICQHFATHSSLEDYIYLKLELVFDKVYYSHKKDQIAVSDTEPAITPAPKKRRKPRPKASEQKIISQLAKANISPKKEVNSAVDSKVCEAVNADTSKRENIMMELQSKKKIVEALRLEHEILVKKSKIIEMEAEINQMEHQIGTVTTPESSLPLTQSTQMPILNSHSPVNNALPTTTHVEPNNALSKCKPRNPSRPKKIPKGVMIQTLISSEQSQQMKAEEPAEMEPDEGVKAESEAEMEMESQDEDEEYVVNFEDERPKKKNTRRRPSSKTILKEPSLVTKQLPKHRVSTSKSSVKQDLNLKKRLHYEQEYDPSQSSSEIRPSRRKRQKAENQRIVVPPEDYFSTNWQPEQERFFVDQLQKVTMLSLSKVSKQLSRQFGKKERFKLNSIREKKNSMFKLCRRKFLSEVSKRKSLTNEEVKALASQLQNIDNRSSFQFINRFLHQYYFSNIDIVVNKAINDTLATITSLRQRPSTPFLDHTPSGSEKDNYTAQETALPESSQTNGNDPARKRSHKREMNRLGITEKDMESTRKRMGQAKTEAKKDLKSTFPEESRQPEIYYEETLKQPNNYQHQKGQDSVTEKKQQPSEKMNAKSANTNLKHAFQNFIEPHEKVGV